MTQRRPAIEVVAIGDELILGDTIDTNGAWLAQRLGEEGVTVVRRTVVGDDDDAMGSAIRDALGRTGIVFCCGGLGATPDDRTRPVVAALYGRPLRVDESWVDVIRERFERRGMVMPEINRRQAELPEGAMLLANDVGTAPGLAIEDDSIGVTILLPGVPRELRWLVENRVLPWLLPRIEGGRHRIDRRVIRVTGLAESVVAERISDITADLAPLTLAFLPVGNGIDLRLTSWGTLSDEAARARLSEADQRLRERLVRYAYGSANDDLAAIVGERLRERGMTIATAESCTGGLVAKRLTDTAGSSAWMIGAVTAYADAIKTGVLGVPEAVLETHGAVSRETAIAMLDGVIGLMGTDAAISVTGIAGPGGGTEDKPVGTVWIAARIGDKQRARLLRLFGERDEIRERSAQAALKLAFDLLDGDAP